MMRQTNFGAPDESLTSTSLPHLLFLDLAIVKFWVREKKNLFFLQYISASIHLQEKKWCNCFHPPANPHECIVLMLAGPCLKKSACEAAWAASPYIVATNWKLSGLIPHPDDL